MIQLNRTLTAIPGIRAGHATNRAGGTGCTVVLCPPGTVGGVDQRGGGPGTRETDLLRPSQHVDNVSAILLSGGSAYGLAAADGSHALAGGARCRVSDRRWRCRADRAGGHPLRFGIGSVTARPGPDMGYQACEQASAEPLAEGSVGAGTGCRVCSLTGNARATKGGIGSACMEITDGLLVAALVAVNALGEVLDERGEILAGLRSRPGKNDFIPVLDVLRTVLDQRQARSNTVIGVVATNARFSKAAVTRVAQMASCGVARTIRPAHTAHDGDTMFALATGSQEADPSVVGAFAAEAVAMAIRHAVRAATSLGGVRAICDRC